MARGDDGRSTRWDGHREERRAELVQAAVRAIDRHGPQAGIAEIAAEAGVSKPVLYRYFTDKDELHAAVGQWGAGEVLDRVLPALRADVPVRERVARGVDAYLGTLEEHPQVFLLLVRHRGADPLAHGKATIAAAFSRILGDTLRGLDVDAGGAEPWAEGVVGVGLAVGEWWVERRTMSRAAVGDYLTAFLWHAFEGAAGELGVPLSALDHPREAPPGEVHRFPGHDAARRG
ncbi:TetR/AcrR family transcriptional regulator [Nocardioides taihuensis]|uniref:TetR/AcrR family transcriptional regulator n=1 Tax=Nocardioides taihuensis TaxID=1835606 RepID=A0ABW0BKT3_9ACTN